MSKIRSAISQRMDLGDLLESFIRSRDYVPAGARRIDSQEELPLALQSHTREIEGVVWRAWDNGKHIRFVKAKGVSRESGDGLQVMFFDMDGRLVGSGVWIWLEHRGWILSDPADVVIMGS